MSQATVQARFTSAAAPSISPTRMNRHTSDQPWRRILSVYTVERPRPGFCRVDDLSAPI